MKRPPTNPDPKSTVVVWYDDSPDKVVEHINKVLERLGLTFSNDGKDHDGYCIYELVDLERAKTRDFNK